MYLDTSVNVYRLRSWRTLIGGRVALCVARRPIPLDRGGRAGHFKAVRHLSRVVRPAAALAAAVANAHISAGPAGLPAVHPLAAADPHGWGRVGMAGPEGAGGAGRRARPPPYEGGTTCNGTLTRARLAGNGWSRRTVRSGGGRGRATDGGYTRPRPTSRTPTCALPGSIRRPAGPKASTPCPQRRVGPWHRLDGGTPAWREGARRKGGALGPVPVATSRT